MVFHGRTYSGRCLTLCRFPPYRARQSPCHTLRLRTGNRAIARLGYWQAIASPQKQRRLRTYALALLPDIACGLSGHPVPAVTRAYVCQCRIGARREARVHVALASSRSGGARHCAPALPEAPASVYGLRPRFPLI